MSQDPLSRDSSSNKALPLISFTVGMRSQLWTCSDFPVCKLSFSPPHGRRKSVAMHAACQRIFTAQTVKYKVRHLSIRA